jgi:excisionase family DNA binding protein
MPSDVPTHRRDWLNVSEAAAYLGVSRETIYALMTRGLVPFSEVRGVRGRRIKKEDLDGVLK